MAEPTTPSPSSPATSNLGSCGYTTVPYVEGNQLEEYERIGYPSPPRRDLYLAMGAAETSEPDIKKVHRKVPSLMTSSPLMLIWVLLFSMSSTHLPRNVHRLMGMRKGIPIRKIYLLLEGPRERGSGIWCRRSWIGTSGLSTEWFRKFGNCVRIWKEYYSIWLLWTRRAAAASSKCNLLQTIFFDGGTRKE